MAGGRGRAKVNLTLRVVGRRMDGYHDLESVVAFADCADKLTLTPGPELSLKMVGPLATACGELSDNLVLKAARLLEAWVFRTLRKSYSDNADTALEVLDNKAGDCTEHTLLFVALARAVRIPAREVGGLAYVRTSKPLFGWHAWAEVHDGHQWVSIDPTWHQVYVDGTHLKMSEGERDLAWANVAGKMQIKVLTMKRFESIG